MTGQPDKKQLLEIQVRDTLKSIYDMEIPVNIYDLGLIYEISISDDFKVHVKMTLTSPNCPVAESLPVQVRDQVLALDEVKDVQVEIVFDPPWNQDMMSAEAKLELGFL